MSKLAYRWKYYLDDEHEDYKWVYTELKPKNDLEYEQLYPYGSTSDLCVITVRNKWRERLSFAWMLLFKWPKRT